MKKKSYFIDLLKLYNMIEALEDNKHISKFIEVLKSIDECKRIVGKIIKEFESENKNKNNLNVIILLSKRITQVIQVIEKLSELFLICQLYSFIYMDLLVKIGRRLKVIRSNSGLKQKDLANKLEIPPSLLSMYEQGKREPSIIFLAKFAKHFNINLSQLFAFIDDEKNKSSEEPTVISLLTEMKSILVSLEKAAQNSVNKDVYK